MKKAQRAETTAVVPFSFLFSNKLAEFLIAREEWSRKLGLWGFNPSGISSV
ncbi:hypothetical protein [Mesobacillus campisalis]|uniref:hypothetical protein n=1 Tax=Mesobacillus campisalis TaxID=1408103 RepID=UPI0012E2DAF9|nr:hypothetical protein [Mesobacillus campisalis]